MISWCSLVYKFMSPPPLKQIKNNKKINYKPTNIINTNKQTITQITKIIIKTLKLVNHGIKSMISS